MDDGSWFHASGPAYIFQLYKSPKMGGKLRRGIRN